MVDGLDDDRGQFFLARDSRLFYPSSHGSANPLLPDDAEFGPGTGSGPRGEMTRAITPHAGGLVSPGGGRTSRTRTLRRGNAPGRGTSKAVVPGDGRAISRPLSQAASRPSTSVRRRVSVSRSRSTGAGPNDRTRRTGPVVSVGQVSGKVTRRPRPGSSADPSPERS